MLRVYPWTPAAVPAITWVMRHFESSLRRRDIIAAGSLAIGGLTGSTGRAQQPEAKPQLDSAMVKEYVSKSHSDLAAVRELSKKEPMLVRAAWRGITPLMQAVLADEPDMVRVLLDRGADVTAKTPAGLSALDFARKRNSSVMAGLLSKT